MKVQLSIKKLEYLIGMAKAAKAKDSSLSNTFEIELVDSSDTHLGDDHIAVYQKSGYAECDSKLMYAHWLPIN